jgi:hypothetical protein
MRHTGAPARFTARLRLSSCRARNASPRVGYVGALDVGPGVGDEVSAFSAIRSQHVLDERADDGV